MRHCRTCGESWDPYEETHDCAVKTTDERLDYLEALVARLTARVAELESKAENEQ
jgi:hypothetical protein